MISRLIRKPGSCLVEIRNEVLSQSSDPQDCRLSRLQHRNRIAHLRRPFYRLAFDGLFLFHPRRVACPVFRASCSADSASVGLSYLWAIAQTRERNWGRSRMVGRRSTLFSVRNVVNSWNYFSIERKK